MSEFEQKINQLCFEYKYINKIALEYLFEKEKCMCT